MNLSLFNPLYEMESLFDRYYKPTNSYKGTLLPTTDVVENDTAYTITAELPGVDKKDVTIDVSDNVLTISGEKTNEVKDEKHHRIERSYGSFTRSFTLPDTVEVSNIKAVCENGVVKVTLPKVVKEEVKKLSIAID